MEFHFRTNCMKTQEQILKISHPFRSGTFLLVKIKQRQLIRCRQIPKQSQISHEFDDRLTYLRTLSEVIQRQIWSILCCHFYCVCRLVSHAFNGAKWRQQFSVYNLELGCLRLIKVDWQEFIPSCIHFLHKTHILQGILFLVG